MEIGFLPIRLWDLLDIAIVGYLIYQLYKLLRGSIAINIFLGVVTLIVLSWLVRALDMEMLSAIMKQLISTGVIILIIIFQPEVRRFLLLLGSTTLKQQSNFINRLLDREEEVIHANEEKIQMIKKAIISMSKRKEGALIVLIKDMNLEEIANSGVKINAEISQPLIESIFFKNSPLHDGAMLISSEKIIATSCILPVSDSTKIPQNAGLRHRAAVGISERIGNVIAFIVSEENGSISYALNGELARRISQEKLEELLELYL